MRVTYILLNWWGPIGTVWIMIKERHKYETVIKRKMKKKDEERKEVWDYEGTVTACTVEAFNILTPCLIVPHLTLLLGPFVLFFHRTAFFVWLIIRFCCLTAARFLKHGPTLFRIGVVNLYKISITFFFSRKQKLIQQVFVCVWVILSNLILDILFFSC